MLLHNNPFFSIYFGNADDELNPDQYLQYPPGIRLLALESYKKLKKLMQLQSLTFLRQAHSDTGFVLTEPVEPFKQEGDFLVTEKKHLGIGVMTADCLPIIFFDNGFQMSKSLLNLYFIALPLSFLIMRFMLIAL